MAKPQKRGVPAIGKHLNAALSADERDEILARLVSGLDVEGRKRLLTELPAATAEALAAALATGKGRRATAPGARKLTSIWEQFRSRWEEIILDTGDEEGPYISKDPHWEPHWLDGSEVTADLDLAAREAVGHLPGIVAAGIDGDLAPGEFLADSREELGAGLPEWFGEMEDQFCPGPVASELFCRWSLAQSLRDGQDGFGAAEELLDFIRDAEGSIDETGIRAALTALPKGRQAELVKGFLSPAGAACLGGLLTDPRTPWARALDDLATRHAPEVALARDREGIDLEIAAVAGGPVDLERDLVVARLLGEHRHAEDEVLRRLFDRAERAAASEDRTARQQAARLQAAAVVGIRHWDGLVQAFQSVPKPYGAVRDSLFSGVKDAVAVLCLPPDLVTDPVARYTDALLDGLIAGADGKMEAVARLAAVVDGAAADEVSFDRYRRPLARLALDLAGEKGLAGKHRLRDLLRDVAGCRWEAEEIRNSRRAAVRVLGAERLLPQILSVLCSHAAALVPDPANAHKSRYGRHAEALAGVRDLDDRAAARILGRWQKAHPRRRNLWEALRGEGFEV